MKKHILSTFGGPGSAARGTVGGSGRGRSREDRQDRKEQLLHHVADEHDDGAGAVAARDATVGERGDAEADEGPKHHKAIGCPAAN